MTIHLITSSVRMLRQGSNIPKPNSVLLLDMRRRMMVGDFPNAIPSDDQHGESRRTCNWLAVLHPSKFIETRDHYGAIPQHDGAPLAHYVLVPAALQDREILPDGVGPFRYDGAHGSEQD